MTIATAFATVGNMKTPSLDQVGAACRDFGKRLPGRPGLAKRFATAAEALFNHRPEAAVHLATALAEANPSVRERFFEALTLEITK